MISVSEVRNEAKGMLQPKNLGHYFTVSIGQQSNVLVNRDKAFRNENLCLKFLLECLYVD